MNECKKKERTLNNRYNFNAEVGKKSILSHTASIIEHGDGIGTLIILSAYTRSAIRSEVKVIISAK